MDVASWIDNPRAWNTCYIGLAELPGIATVSAVPCGPRIDKQKRRKKEGSKLKDEGLKPAEFSIELWMTAAEWTRWLAILPMIHSVKIGDAREPKQIVHPLPNHMGVKTIYIKSVKPGMPTAKGGFKVTIDVEQWFAEQPDTKAKSKVKSNSVVANYYKDPFEPVGIDAIEKYAYDKDPFVGKREVD